MDDNPETDSKAYLSKLISLGIYNFTRNAEGINYLLVHPHTYKDVVNIHNIQDIETQQTVVNNTINVSAGESRIKIIGVKNVTNHAGATTFIYMLLKVLSTYKSVTALEVNKVDFLYFNHDNMSSTTSNDL